MFHTIHKGSPFTILNTLVFTVVQNEKFEAEPLQTLLKCAPSTLKTSLLMV
jgi:hypothetical protein